MTGETLLLRNARVYDARPGVGATAVAVRDGRIIYVGDTDGAESYRGGPELDLDGALVTAAFVDTHVHTVRTGFALTGLDLTGSPTLRHTLDALGAHARASPDAGVLLGQGWDESPWPEGRVPTGDELERAAPGRRSCLTRVDAHSSVISPALAALVPGLDQLDGWTTDGRVERDAHHAVRNVLEGLIGPEDRLDAARVACRAMAARGIVGFHENAAPHIGPETEIEVVRRAADEVGLRATVYWGELLAVDTATRLGVAGLAGDLVADGAFGSRTAALTAAYSDRSQTCGHAYVSADQVRDHVVACTQAGLQAGFHCIGDAALTAIDEGLLAAEAVLGAERIAAARHRLEHVEMPSRHMIETMGRLGIVASVQPMFDALWGGPDAMYAARLGDRWDATNPFGDLEAGGVRLSFGSDSPVTPLGPWGAIRAAVHHRTPGQGLPAPLAFRAHTRGGTYAARDDEGGTLALGQRGDLAVWDVSGDLTADGLPDLSPDGDLPVLRRLFASGRTIHDSEETSP